MEPKKISDLTNGVYQIEKDYQVIVSTPFPYLFIVVGYDYNKRGAKFTGDSLLGKRYEVHEYKHYRTNGSKFWTSRAGVDLLFAVPLHKITLLPEKGYSYVKAEVGGEKITLNVSGGTENGWTDVVSPSCHIFTNAKPNTLKAIASNAIPKSEFHGDIKWFEESENRKRDLERFNKIVEASKARIRTIKEIDSGKAITIKLWSGYDDKMVVNEVLRRRRWIGRDEQGNEIYKKCPPHGFSDGHWIVKFSLIDWNATARINNWNFAI